MPQYQPQVLKFPDTYYPMSEASPANMFRLSSSSMFGSHDTSIAEKWRKVMRNANYNGCFECFDLQN